MQIFCNMAGPPAKQGVSYTSKEKGGVLWFVLMRNI